MTSHTHPMFNPFDGTLFIAGTVVSFSFGIFTGNSPVLAAIAGATVTGIFLVIAKGIELYVKSRTDKRIAELEAKLNGK